MLAHKENPQRDTGGGGSWCGHILVRQNSVRGKLVQNLKYHEKMWYNFFKKWVHWGLNPGLPGSECSSLTTQRTAHLAKHMRNWVQSKIIFHRHFRPSETCNGEKMCIDLVSRRTWLQSLNTTAKCGTILLCHISPFRISHLPKFPPSGSKAMTMKVGIRFGVCNNSPADDVR